MFRRNRLLEILWEEAVSDVDIRNYELQVPCGCDSFVVNKNAACYGEQTAADKGNGALSRCSYVLYELACSEARRRGLNHVAYRILWCGIFGELNLCCLYFAVALSCDNTSRNWGFVFREHAWWLEDKIWCYNERKHSSCLSWVLGESCWGYYSSHIAHIDGPSNCRGCVSLESRTWYLDVWVVLEKHCSSGGCLVRGECYPWERARSSSAGYIDGSSSSGSFIVCESRVWDSYWVWWRKCKANSSSFVSITISERGTQNSCRSCWCPNSSSISTCGLARLNRRACYYQRARNCIYWSSTNRSSCPWSVKIIESQLACAGIDISSILRSDIVLESIFRVCPIKEQERVWGKDCCSRLDSFRVFDIQVAIEGYSRSGDNADEPTRRTVWSWELMSYAFCCSDCCACWLSHSGSTDTNSASMTSHCIAIRKNEVSINGDHSNLCSDCSSWGRDNSGEGQIRKTDAWRLYVDHSFDTRNI